MCSRKRCRKVERDGNLRPGSGLRAGGVLFLMLWGLTAVPAAEAAVPAGAELEAAELVELDPSEWADPPDIFATRGLLTATLTAGISEHVIRVGPQGRPQRVRLRTYNGSLTGPTLHFEAGNRLSVRLVNNLPKTENDVCPEGHEHAADHFGYNLTNEVVQWWGGAAEQVTKGSMSVPRSYGFHVGLKY